MDLSGYNQRIRYVAIIIKKEFLFFTMKTKLMSLYTINSDH